MTTQLESFTQRRYRCPHCRLYALLADIRAAVGDQERKLSPVELVERCRNLHQAARDLIELRADLAAAAHADAIDKMLATPTAGLRTRVWP